MSTQRERTDSAFWPRLLLFLALLAALAAFYATGLYRYLDWDTMRGGVAGWREQAQRNLLVAALLFFAAYVALTVLSLPVAGALSILCGALFDRWLGLALASLSATTGATLGFLVGRYLLHGWVRRHFGHRLHAIDRGVRRDGAFYLFTLRLSPVPFFLINLGMALTPMRLSTFISFTWLGMLLPSFFYVNAGSELAHIERPADVLSPEVLGSLALLGAVPLLFRLLLRFRKG
jgi:uncharacterized membrane protein YdjX (TVP38/TMEM64 family)